jgi:tetratricopeptide (TPR) repeat protein
VYFLALLPTLGLVNMAFMMHSFVADHWQYLALPALIALIVSQCWRYLSPRGSMLRKASLALAAAVVITLTILSHTYAATFAGPIPLWRHTLEINPAAEAAHVNLAAALVEEKKYDEAMAQYQAALNLKPNESITYNNIGLLYARQEQYEQAVENYNKALALQPRYADAHYDLAVALAHLEQFAPAAQHFAQSLQDRYVEDAPAKLADRHEGLASALVKLDRLEEALTHYNQALQLVPDHTMALTNRQTAWHLLALKHARAGDLPAALACFDQALTVAPRDGRLWLARGEMLIDAGKLDQAHPCFAKLEELEPGWAQQSFEEAHKAEVAGNVRQAMEFYRKATLARTPYPAALNNLAWLLATTSDDSLRNGKQAVAYAEAACAAASPAQRSRMQLCLSAAYAEAGMGEQAVAAARKAQEFEKTAGRNDQVQSLEGLIAIYQHGQTYRDYLKSQNP